MEGDRGENCTLKYSLGTSLVDLYCKYTRKFSLSELYIIL